MFSVNHYAGKFFMLQLTQTPAPTPPLMTPAVCGQKSTELMLSSDITTATLPQEVCHNWKKEEQKHTSTHTAGCWRGFTHRRAACSPMKSGVSGVQMARGWLMLWYREQYPQVVCSANARLAVSSRWSTLVAGAWWLNGGTANRYTTSDGRYGCLLLQPLLVVALVSYSGSFLPDKSCRREPGWAVSQERLLVVLSVSLLPASRLQWPPE